MSSERTRQVVEKYFTDLERGDVDSALQALSHAIDFELPVDRYNEVIPYLGRHVGLPAVRKAFAVRGETTEVLDYALRDVRAEGDTAYAVIYTRAAPPPPTPVTPSRRADLRRAWPTDPLSVSARRLVAWPIRRPIAPRQAPSPKPPASTSSATPVAGWSTSARPRTSASG
ncbi:nuclear transport factor 2 family protein [Saccharothrix sp. Mg75]|uniref:nuclear transport factor 2 family protein n=1 Tax=Saccharothrix sp. Mg75 TaxID=3445357 RepID=UPI003EEE5BC2